MDRHIPLMRWIKIGSVLAVMALFVVLVWHHAYEGVSFLLLAVTFLPFFLRFERKNVQARELVLLAVLSAIAAVSRIPFASIPSVQPTTFVIIVSGLVFGGESGFVIGSLAALVSNLFLGQGPWTPWQMVAWGVIGGGAGLLRRFKWMQTKWGRVGYGIVSGYFFGWIMNIWSLFGLQITDWKTVLTLYGSSFYFDTAHALSNVVFLILFSSSWIKILQRFQRKYGLLDVENSSGS